MTSSKDQQEDDASTGCGTEESSPRSSNFETNLSLYASSLPLFDELRSHLRVSGRRIGWHCHLTALTVIAARCLVEAGAQVFMSECDHETSDAASINALDRLGISVFLDAHGPGQVLQAKPEVICDTGGELLSRYLQGGSAAFPSVKAASEITTSGIMRLPPSLPLPVINLNNGQLKNSIENFHGVGDGVVELLRMIAPRSWAGRSAVVIGYGQVGAGVAWHLNKLGCSITVVDKNPVRQLIAHFDGFKTGSLIDSLKTAALVVTATGSGKVVCEPEIRALPDECLLMNVGHFAHEIDCEFIEKAADSRRQTNVYTTEYELGLKKLSVVCGGHPANVVALTGFPEPTLIHLTNELLTMSYLLEDSQLAPGLHMLPADIERLCAAMALRSLKIPDWRGSSELFEG